MNKDNKKEKPLSWDDFIKLGNPENVKEEFTNIDDSVDPNINYSSRVRIRLDRKKRKGKGVTLIEGIDEKQGYLDKLSKELKKSCGVGGTSKDGLILIQGDHRKRILEILTTKGFKDVKISGG